MKHEKPPSSSSSSTSVLPRLPLPYPPSSVYAYLSCSRHLPLFSLSPQSKFECITGTTPPPLSRQSPTVRWRYNDHRHMNHGPAETCIFMPTAHSLVLSARRFQKLVFPPPLPIYFRSRITCLTIQ